MFRYKYISLISGLLVGAFFFLSMPVKALQPESNQGRPKVAVVLSGGGAKGFSHIGVLKVLEEEGIPVDMIVGTSIGSLVGGIYAMGYSADEIYHIAKSQRWDALLTDEVPRAYLSKQDQMIRQRYLLSLDVGLDKKIGLPQALKKGQNVMNLFCGLAGNVPMDMDFAKLPIPFACVAADLETGEEVVMKDGFLPTAMFSSMAIPAVFQSPQRGQRTLVDGGVVNNFPVDVAKAMGADIVIGVDLQRDPPKKDQLNSMDMVVSQMVSFMSKEKYAQNLRMCDILIRPDVSKYSMLAFTEEALDTLTLRGRVAADKYREEFRRIKAKYHLEPNTISRQYIMPEKWRIDQICFKGNYSLDEEFLKSMMGLTLHTSYSYQEIKNAIDRIYGLGGFERIYFDLTGEGDAKILNLDVIPQKVQSQNFGFKANTTDAAALMFNITRKGYGKRFTLLSGNAELSANPGLSLVAETSSRNFTTLGVELKSKFQHINVLENGRKAFNIDIFYTSANAYLHQSFLSKYQVGLGIKEEFFRGDIFSKYDYQELSPDKSNYWVTNPYLYVSLDNLDNFYFPTKGTNLYAEVSLNTDLKYLERVTPTLLIRMNNVIPLQPRLALQTALYSRMMFNKDYPLAKLTMVGGESYSQYFNYHLPFVGLPPVMLADRYTLIGALGARYRLSQNRYLSLTFNELLQTNDAVEELHFSSVFGGGVKYSIKTVVGPLDFGVGLSDMYKKPTFSANLGFWF